MVAEIIKGMPMEEYKARPGVNGSLLATIDLYCLKIAKAELDGLRDTETDAKSFGTAFHSLFLEGKRDYSIRPDTYPAPARHDKVKKGEINEGDPLPWNANAKECSDWLTANPNWMKTTEATDLEGMAAALSSDPQIAQYLEGADKEVSVFAVHDGIPVKARIDILPKVGPVMDPKKTTCAEGRAFITNDFIKYRYFMKCAWHLDVLRWAGDTRSEFWLLPVESDPPYAHGIVKLVDQSMSFLRMGRRRCRVAFAKVKEAYEKNRWPAYGSYPPEEFAPAWMMQELEMTA